MNFYKTLLGILLICTSSITFFSCYTQWTSTIDGANYNKKDSTTEYFIIPYGVAKLPGKWEKAHYNQISKQQFFVNADSVEVAIAFGTTNNFEFNQDEKLRGLNFVKAFYEWDTNYFVEKFGLQRRTIEEDSTNNFMIYEVYGKVKNSEINSDTYYLVGVKNTNFNNFSIPITNKWTKQNKIDFLRNLFLKK